MMQQPSSGSSSGSDATAFRLPRATHVGGVQLQVSDLARSVDYYGQVLGLHLLSEEGQAAGLAPREAARALVTLRTRSGVRPARRGAFGLFHFAIRLPDRAALGRFAAHLSALGLRIGAGDHLVSEAIYLSDPDGLGIEVYADRPADTWQRKNGELVMTTDRLDVAGIIAEAGGEKWDGAPPGTVMGHVHLSVGSLEEAEAFYHQGLGLDKTVWSYPGALFMSAGGYHHHVGTNVWSPGPSPAADEARLLEWDLVVPSRADVTAVADRLRAAGYEAEPAANGVVAEDPWHTQVRVVAEE